jgi:hypothetical protein
MGATEKDLCRSKLSGARGRDVSGTEIGDGLYQADRQRLK